MTPILQAAINGITPDQDFTVTQWADTYRMLPKVASNEAGEYRSHRTPYLVEIMDALSVSSPVRELCVMKAARLGFTEAGNNLFFYVVDMAQGPMLMMLPTGVLAAAHSKQIIAPSILAMDRIAGKIVDSRVRGSGNTIMSKEFPGGILYLSGANSGAFFRNKTIRYLFLDEVDGYPADVGGEGDPVELAKKRTTTYSNRKKIYIVSTPTIKGFSRIENELEASDQRYYFVPCPRCGKMQKLEWGGGGKNDYGIKFKRNRMDVVESAWYECIGCNRKIAERYKTEIMAIKSGARWRPKKPGMPRRGYQISALYSPLGWASWKDIATEFIEAKGNREKLKVWNNATMGLPFEEKGSQPAWAALKARAEPYEVMTVPGNGILLTAGVDTQDNRLIVSVYAWGKGEESWLVYHGELYGDPAQDAVWNQLDFILDRSYRHVDGADLRIQTMAIDTAGHRTHSVYNYCRQRTPRVIAIQGAKRPGRPVISSSPSLQDVDYAGEKIAQGVQLWTVGTDTAKAVIYGRLNLVEPGPGYLHFPIGLGDDFYMQLTAEKLTTEFRKGFPHTVWVATRDNHALDTCVYAFAAASRAGLSMLEYEQIEKLIKTQGGEGPGPRPDDDKPTGFIGGGSNFLGTRKGFLR